MVGQMAPPEVVVAAPPRAQVPHTRSKTPRVTPSHTRHKKPSTSPIRLEGTHSESPIPGGFAQAAARITVLAVRSNTTSGARGGLWDP